MKIRRSALLALLALGAAAFFPSAASTQSGPIKIGLLVPLSGAFSATGKDMLSDTLPLPSGERVG